MGHTKRLKPENILYMERNVDLENVFSLLSGEVFQWLDESKVVEDESSQNRITVCSGSCIVHKEKVIRTNVAPGNVLVVHKVLFPARAFVLLSESFCKINTLSLIQEWKILPFKTFKKTVKVCERVPSRCEHGVI